jgi:hypothetical protein
MLSLSVFFLRLCAFAGNFYHESLSQVLGTGRTGITMAANKLQKVGLIQIRRGQLTILDREGMEAISCDCYQLTKDVFEHSSQ